MSDSRNTTYGRQGLVFTETETPRTADKAWSSLRQKYDGGRQGLVFTETETPRTADKAWSSLRQKHHKHHGGRQGLVFTETDTTWRPARLGLQWSKCTMAAKKAWSSLRQTHNGLRQGSDFTETNKQ
ncbi:hypothetical protein CHS0354_024814 [Potamilus streckersoni]|uniref:Uncharacterized protein n=1 Tax=Potamilus streckersoni TaxID=2493646 RepID=A0AAE0W4E3_9BIVA|nr:hypothetical protein CHS0354_024814 [Potamilus streckersoni]